MRTPSILLSLLVAVAAVAAVACGGDSTATPAPATPTPTATPTGPTYDALQADAVAHAALLAEGDLPGQGWAVEASDDFSDDDLGDSEACQRAEQIRDLNKVERDADRAGKAQIELSTPGTGSGPVSVNSAVHIFKSTEVPLATLDNFLGAVHGGDFVECIKDGMLASLPAGSTVEVLQTAQHVQPPHRGIAFAWQLNIVSGDEHLAVAIEYHLWADSNAGVTVAFFGPPEAITTELVKAAVEKADQKLTAQAK